MILNAYIAIFCRCNYDRDVKVGARICLQHMFENLYGCYSFIVLHVTSITIINRNTTILFKNLLLIRQINFC